MSSATYSETPYLEGADAGTFFSPGDVLQFQESELTHPTQTDGLVDKNDLVICPGGIPGIALNSATATTSLISVAISGIFSIPVIPADVIGNEALNKGDLVVVDVSTCLAARGRANGTPLGQVLSAEAAGATAVNLPVAIGAAAVQAVENATQVFTAATGNLNSHGITLLDSSSNAINATLDAGQYPGQRKTIVMTEASNSSTVSITSHQTSDPEVATFDAVDETLELMWTGTEWVTIFATATFV